MFSAKTHIREERSRNATFPNINKHLVYPHWYQCFQTGWESRKQGGGSLLCCLCPDFTSLGVRWVFIIIWGPIFSQVYSEREGGDDRNQKETWTWQAAGEHRGNQGGCYTRERESKWASKRMRETKGTKKERKGIFKTATAAGERELKRGFDIVILTLPEEVYFFCWVRSKRFR